MRVMRRLLAILSVLALALPPLSALAQDSSVPVGPGGLTVLGVNGTAYNQYAAQSYGNCVWDGAATHDVGPCINAAYAACAAAASSIGGGTVNVPAGLYYVATALSNGTNGCKMRGAGIGMPRNTTTPTLFVASTRLVWNGANNATFMSLSPGGSTSLFDAGIEGVVFDCNAVCNTALKATQISFSTFDVGVAEGLKYGAWITTNAGSDSPGTQKNHLRIYARHTATSNNKTVGTVSASCPTGIFLDGNATWNYSYNADPNGELYAWQNCGDGIVLGNIDENDFGLIGVGQEPSVLWGRSIVFANSNYTQANGDVVTAGPYHNRVFKTSAPIYLLGYNTGAVVTQGVHAGTGVYNPVTIATNATTANLSKTLNFASTTNITAGQVVDCGAGSNMYRNTIIASLTATTLVMTDEAYGTVPSSQSCTAKVGMTASAASGTYTITAVDGTHLSITTAPAGGHTQSNILITAGAVTFTDMVFPITGTPNANDTWTVAVPTTAVFSSIDWIDRNNSVAIPMAEPGASLGLVCTSNARCGLGSLPVATDATGGSLRIGAALYLPGTSGIVGPFNASSVTLSGTNTSQSNLAFSATFGVTASGVANAIVTPNDGVLGAKMYAGSGGEVNLGNGTTNYWKLGGSGQVSVLGTALPTQAAGTLGLAGTATGPTLGANSEGDIWLTAAGGLNLTGQGSTNDFTLLNKSAGSVCTVATGTTTLNCTGLQVNSVAAVGTTTTQTLTSKTLTDPIDQTTHINTATISKTDTTLSTGSITGLSQSLTAAGLYSCNGWIHFTTAPTASNGAKVALATSDTLTVNTLSFTVVSFNAAAFVAAGTGTATALATAPVTPTAAMTDIQLQAMVNVNAAGTLQVQLAESTASGTIAATAGNVRWDCHRAA